MFDVTSDEIASLNAEDLRTLVALLCEAEVSLKGFSRSAVTWGGSQTAPDGGLDVRVSLPAGSSIEGFLPRFSTGIQVKKENMRRSKIISEMRPSGTIRDVIQNLAEEGGAYVIASSGTDAADIELYNRHDAMREALAGVVNADRLHTDFYDRNRLASWVRSHPGLIAWVKEKGGRAVSGWQPFRNWSGGPDGEYILDERLRLHFSKREDAALTPEEGINKLRGMLSEPKSVVRLVGLSGVGKTRLIQALFDERIGSNPLPPATAVYTNLSDDPDPQPIGLTTNLIGNRARAVLIVDNCPPDLHRRLADLCQRSESTVSVLTVEYDIRDDQPEGTEVVRLDTSSEELIEKLVLLRFPNVSQVDARTIAEVSGGNARIAIALARTIEGTATISGLTDEELFQRLFKQGHDPNDALLFAAQACSLVYSFNGDVLSGDKAELPTLASLAEQTPRELYRHVAELCQRDLVQQRSIWRAVLPHAIANRLAAFALQNIPRQEIEHQLIVSGSERLARSFSRRLSYLHNSPQAVAIVQDWLAPNGLLGNVEGLDELRRAMLENIAPVLPAATLAAIERVQDDTDPAEAAGVWSRHLRLLRSLAYEPELFERCANILIKTALMCPVEGKSKEASDYFTSLFHIYLSGTHATVTQRLNVIGTLLRSSQEKEQGLGLKAMHAILEAGHFSSAHDFTFGAHSRDHGYNPKTRREVHDWYAAALSLLDQIVFTESHLQTKLRDMLAAQFRGLWTSAGMWNELEELCRKFNAQSFWREGWAACRSTAFFDHERMHPNVLERLSALEQMLKPRDLVQRVRAIVLTSGSGGLDIDELLTDEDFASATERMYAIARELGRAVAIDHEAFTELLPDLTKGGSRVSFFAGGLADGTSNLCEAWEQLVSQYVATPLDQRNWSVLTGFLAQAWNRDSELAHDLLDEALASSNLSAIYPALQSAVPVDEKGVDRLRRSLTQSGIPINAYRQLAYARFIDAAAGDVLGDLLTLIASQNGGVEVAIEILGMRIHSDRSDKRDHHHAILQAGREILLRVRFSRRHNDRYYDLKQIVKSCLTRSASSGAASQMARSLKEAVHRHEVYSFDVSDVVKALLKVQPNAVLSALFPADETDHQQGLALFEHTIEGERNPVDVVSLPDLLSWCDEIPGVRYLVAASIITFARRPDPKEPLTWSEEALALLDRAPDPAAVLKTLANRFLPMSWGGSRAAIIEANAKLLDNLDLDASSRLAETVRSLRAWLAERVAQERRAETKEDRERDERFE
jgi:hypothetical protein